jgi:hypothetical protein
MRNYIPARIVLGTTAVLLTFLSCVAFGQSSSRLKDCIDGAHLVKRIMVMRDQGYTKQFFIKNIDKSGRDSRLQILARQAVDLAFDPSYSDIPAGKAHNVMVEICYENYGPKVRF